MTPERYTQIDGLVADALELEFDKRDAFLTQMCGADQSLRQEVEAWIAAHHEADERDFLATNVMANYVELLASDQAPAHFLSSSEATRDGRSTSAFATRYGDYLGTLLKQRYRIKKELGRGAIGVVYLALDKQLYKKPVAIKVLLEKSLQNPWFKKKLAQEVEALSRIDHPGVVEALDCGETPDGNPFLVMKFVDGKTLRSLIKDGRLGLPRVAEIVRQIGQALSAAHDQKVIHCDLKPENIMVQTLAGNRRQIKIVDFGVAKVRNSQVVAEADGTLVAGTPSYMAPEHVGGSPTSASDIFSFGVIAYELVTGEHPFKESLEGRNEMIRRGLIKRPGELRPELSIAAEEIILKALSFEQEDRYQQARDFGELLAQELTADPESPSRGADYKVLDVEMAHILFMDIVGYSKLATDDESQIYKKLQGIVSGVDSFHQAKTHGQVISRGAGDGIALIFFSNPKAPAQCAFEIARMTRSDPHIQLRMGINSGPVYRVKDMNGVEDVAGAGINMAQRVMDCGDAGHILASKSVADVLKELVGWRDALHDLGEHKVKHGARVHLFNVYNREVGNPKAPEKLRKRRAGVFLLGFIAAALLICASLFASKPLVISEVERSLSYSARVQKYRDGRPFEEPFQLSSSNLIFEKDYRLKLNFSSQQTGYFYIINQPPAQDSDVPRLIVLHASTNSGDEPALLNTEFPEDTWLKFDDKKGAERLWLIWSARKVAALEAVRGLDNRRDDGRITDLNQARAVHEFLKTHTASAPIIAEDKEKKVTRIAAKGEALVYPLELQHQ